MRTTLSFILALFIGVLTTCSLKNRDPVRRCSETTYKLRIITSTDTVFVRTCHYGRVTGLDSDKTWLCFYEHLNESVHVRRLVPIDSVIHVKKYNL